MSEVSMNAVIPTATVCIEMTGSHEWNAHDIDS